MYAGIEINSNKTFTVALMDSNRNISYISHFWKEGLYWFLDHSKIKILTININFRNKKHLSTNFRVYLDLKTVLISQFEFFEFSENFADKKIALTDTDRFFEKSIRKQLLPIYTREGLEQRIYNLPKSGIYLPKYMLSKDRNRLKSELNATVSAFTSFALDNNLYTIEEENEEKIVVPLYKFVPKEKRIVTGASSVLRNSF